MQLVLDDAELHEGVGAEDRGAEGEAGVVGTSALPASRLPLRNHFRPLAGTPQLRQLLRFLLLLFLVAEAAAVAVKPLTTADVTTPISCSSIVVQHSRTHTRCTVVVLFSPPRLLQLLLLSHSPPRRLRSVAVHSGSMFPRTALVFVGHRTTRVHIISSRLPSCLLVRRQRCARCLATAHGTRSATLHAERYRCRHRTDVFLTNSNRCNNAEHKQLLSTLTSDNVTTT